MAGKAKTPAKRAVSNGRKSSRNGVGRERASGYGPVDAPAGHRAGGQVAEIQRVRMLTAMVQEVGERGVANVRVGNVVGRSGVSRRTFYEIFKDCEDCFLATFDDALEQVARTVVPAYEEAGGWRTGVRSALTALLSSLERDRAIGRLLVVESLAAGRHARVRRQSVLAQIVHIIDEGQSEGKAMTGPSALTAEGIVGGILSVLYARLVEGTQGSLLDLTGPLMGMIVLPYLGPGAAREENERPTPKHAATEPMVRTDPLQNLPMRLTYRTMRVLASVAEQPGSSNRTIGEEAGIGDQGQASKLLARLHKLGLVENEGGDAARGEPNAWALTPTGKQVHDSIASLEKRSA